MLPQGSSRSRRPVFLNLFKIRFPVPALVSIAHRVSGALLVIAILPAVALLALSLSGPEGFDRAAQWMASWPARLLGLLLAWSLVHHLLAGIRFLLLDMEWGIERRTARLSAGIVLAAGVVLGLVMWGGML